MRFLVVLKYLWLEQMLDIRKVWPFTVVFGMVMPLGMVFGIARIGVGLTDPQSLLYIVTGAAIFSVTSESIANLAQRISQMRTQGMLLYYSALPISKNVFCLALSLSRMFLALPGMITPVVVGVLMYEMHVSVSPWLLLLLPLASLSLATVGVAAGMLVRSADLIITITNIVVFVVFLAAPVMIPMSALPLPLQLLGRSLPPTYAADALRRTLSSRVDGAVYSDMMILAAMTLGSFVVLTRLLKWRRM
jgi:ABC-2 type transport system permease protein